MVFEGEKFVYLEKHIFLEIEIDTFSLVGNEESFPSRLID
jgi:hypothetical protein